MYFGLYSGRYYPRYGRFVDVYYDDPYYYPSYYGSYTTVYTAPPVTERIYEETVVYPEDTVVVPQSGATVVPEMTEVMPPVQAEDAGDTQDLDAEALTWVDRGIEAFAGGDYENAKDFYVRAIFADDEDGVAKLLYALANVALGDFELAEVSLRRAMEDTPELVDNPIDLRGFYPNEETFNSHQTLLVGRLEEQPDDRTALFLLGYLHYATGTPAQAVEKLERLMALDGTDELALRLRDAAKQHVAAPVAKP